MTAGGGRGAAASASRGEAPERRGERSLACDNPPPFHRQPRTRARRAAPHADRHARPIVSPYEIAVGLRYTRARRGSGRNSFISFIALTSMAGIALGVAALIVVLSVMNGFQDELRTRILSVASHIEIRGLPTLDDEAAVAAVARANPRVKAAAPVRAGAGDAVVRARSTAAR